MNFKKDSTYKCLKTFNYINGDFKKGYTYKTSKKGYLILNGREILEIYNPENWKDTFLFLHDNKKETVNHPDHYKGNNFEVIDIIHDYGLGFDLGNAVKYILRAGKKDDAVQDFKKAIWYIEHHIKVIQDEKTN